MKKQILQQLGRIEQQHGVEILYACEAGSRAWGFPSKDSDYDIRFIYVRPKIDYLVLNVGSKRDVIEVKGNAPLRRSHPGLLDFDGWDLRKALGLLKKSNPPLFEWFRSPTVYKSDTTFVAQINQVMPRYYNYSAMCYHYLHMAKGNFRDYLQGEKVWLKKYLYVLRPMLAVMYLIEYNQAPPLDFLDLVTRMVHPGLVKTEICKLLTRKKQGEELDYGPVMPAISDYILENLEILSNYRFQSTGGREKDWNPLNNIFLMTLNDRDRVESESFD